MNDKKADVEPGSGRESSVAADLRLRAESRAAEMSIDDSASLSSTEEKRLLHHLRVHQIELELQNEELLRAQAIAEGLQARYFDLYDLAPVGYVTLQADGSIAEANLRASTLLATPRQALVNQPLTRFIVADDQDTYYRKRKALVEKGQAQVCELRMKQPDGPPRWVRLEACTSSVADDGPPIFRVTLSDITETRALQAKLAQADRMASLGIVAAGVAHEINNPLTYTLFNLDSVVEALPRIARTAEQCMMALVSDGAIEARLELTDQATQLLETRAFDGLLEQASEAAEGAHRIADITRGLGHFARPEPNHRSNVDLNEAARHAITMVTNEIRYRAKLVEDFGLVPPILASEGKLAQVFLNLIVNAAHSIKEGNVEGNRITVRTWAKGDDAFAEVSDTGCGIPKEDRDQIFEPFFTSKGPDQGTGLGLAITRRIVAEFGGDIDCESTLGVGTRFVVRLPIGRAAPKVAPLPGVPPSMRGRILVVDDEQPVRSVIEKILGPDHEVVAVGSGQEARKVVELEPRFDVVLCDLMMPNMSGIELHAWLDECHPTLAKRVVFVTGGVFTPHTHEYLDRISNPRITKPFDPASLKKLVGDLVQATLEGAARQPEDDFAAADP